MVQKQGYIKERYDAFICHETNTAHHFALHLKKSLEKMGKKAFMAPNDIKTGEDEEEKRYSIIQESPDFIIIMTRMALEQSPEVRREIIRAMELNKNIITCLEFNINPTDFKSSFPEVAKKQWIRFTNEYDLANMVTTYYIDEKERLLSQENMKSEYQEGLIVRPKWSINKITQNNNFGHIIFELKNKTDKQMIIHGYRMFRITPSGEKSVYYKGKMFDASKFNWWISDPHVKTTLWQNDEHVFHWNDVNIIQFYGINEKGIWTTEVQIAYIEQGNDTLLYSVGKTNIEFEYKNKI